MRRSVRRKNKDDMSLKIIRYIGIGLVFLAIVVTALMIYSRNLNKEVREGTLTSEQIANMMNKTNTFEDTESASSEIGKSVNEMENEIERETDNTILDSDNNTINNNVLKTNNIKPTSMDDNNSVSKTNIENKENNLQKVELSFVKPVEGEIIKEFAKDSLTFSETLQEWTTHPGIDIKADKTTVVNSAEGGIVKSIKNDPRYGLTVIIEHADGFETVYSNLLSSEFVVEGEKVEKGQAIGTVGNQAAFEMADEPHLHFEMVKDGVLIDPSIYIK